MKTAYKSLVLNALISRNFLRIKVRVNFRNFHTVAHQPPFGRLAQSNWEMLRIPKQWISSYLMSLRKKAMAGHFLMMLPRKQRPFKCFSAFIAIFPWNQSNVLEFTILFSIKNSFINVFDHTTYYCCCQPILIAKCLRS